MMLFQFGLFNGAIDPTQIDAATVLTLILAVIKIALALIGLVAFFYIVLGGIQYITSFGDPAKQTEARKAITAAIVGFIIVVSAFIITNTLLRELDFRDTIIRDDNGTGFLDPIKDLFKTGR